MVQIAKLFDLTISLKQKHVYLQFGGVEVKETDLDQKNLYDVEFFQDYFEKRKKLKAPELKDLVQVYREEKISKEKELPSEEKFWESYPVFRRNRDTVHEFEIELSLNQIEKVVDDGIYIKFKVFIRETSSYYVYHKDDAPKNAI